MTIIPNTFKSVRQVEFFDNEREQDSLILAWKVTDTGYEPIVLGGRDASARGVALYANPIGEDRDAGHAGIYLVETGERFSTLRDAQLHFETTYAQTARREQDTVIAQTKRMTRLASLAERYPTASEQRLADLADRYPEPEPEQETQHE